MGDWGRSPAAEGGADFLSVRQSRGRGSAPTAVLSVWTASGSRATSSARQAKVSASIVHAPGGPEEQRPRALMSSPASRGFKAPLCARNGPGRSGAREDEGEGEEEEEGSKSRPSSASPTRSCCRLAVSCC
ncbi:hypothetical protein EYF80_041801 [Liparis tanakae]|uniref:Uncharacterized protein n=1 Tax=Liparis tanakae TaxID=230148 RepID=A0A4Z2G364_9TELE|nr:hypothetical protein EYF80_041801 [Liparis tanakae]